MGEGPGVRARAGEKVLSSLCLCCPHPVRQSCQIDALRASPSRLSLGNLPGKMLALNVVRAVITKGESTLL